MNKDDIRALRNAYAIAVEDNRVLNERLEKIKAYLTNTCLICGQNNTSKCVDCGCTKVNEIIEGAEDD